MELDISWEVDSCSESEQEELSRLLKMGISEALLSGGGPEDAEISLVLVDDETIHLLNKTYRGVDQPTDVLSFALQEKGEGEPDIYLADLLESEEGLAADKPFGEKELAEEAWQGADYSVEEIMEEELKHGIDLRGQEELPTLELLEDIAVYEDSVLGDIVISVERARKQAEEYGHSFAREIVYLAVHGTFHLLGYDHTSDEEASVMRRMEERVMERIGLPR